MPEAVGGQDLQEDLSSRQGVAPDQLSLEDTSCLTGPARVTGAAGIQAALSPRDGIISHAMVEDASAVV